jgi:hypothetical protein
VTQVIWLDDFVDEVVPCDCTLQGWADWLSKPDLQWNREAPAQDGAVFKAAVLELGEDIIATPSDDEPWGWALSREPGDDEFVAVRHGPGLGWDAEAIIERSVEFYGEDLRFTNSMADAVRAWLDENECEGPEVLAVGRQSSGWSVHYHAGPPPHCTLVRPS